MTRTPREQAFDILLKIEKDKAYSNLLLDSAVRSFSDSTGRAFIARIVYGVQERKITLDYIYSQYLSGNKKLKPQVLTALRMGTYQLIFMDKIPESAAVNESVALVKNNGCAFAAGLVNAVLHKVAKNGFSIPEDLPIQEKLSLRFSVPQELISFFLYHYGQEITEAFFESTLKEKVITIRVNTEKTTAEEITRQLQNEGVRVEKASLENALYIYVSKAIPELEAYQKGLFHVEDIASQICVGELELKKGQTLLDVCSAPGGKAFTAAQYVGKDGLVVACDLYEQRVGLIEEGAKRLGLSVKGKVNDATYFNETLGEFDAVLCDVPCSGLGIIGKKPEIKYKSLDEIKPLYEIQKNILFTSAGYVKKGGTLVYSTCSVNPNENRKICDAFLKENPAFQSLCVAPDLPRAKEEGDYLTLMPHINHCDGFFIAKFIKVN